MTTVEMIWRGKQSEALLDTTRYLDVEGALRASKTTICLWKELNACLETPGIHTLLSRWTDDATHGILKPIWRAILQKAGVTPQWHAREEYDELPGGSRAYIRGLKASEDTNRYGKFRGLTLARFYVDQAEELPHDVYQELKGRLSQVGYTQQGVISPNPPSEDHWIAREFPESNHLRDHKYIRLSIYDNAHNLDPETIASLEREFPAGHAKHGPTLLGTRGLNVTGQAVYGGAFRRQLHVRATTLNPQLPLLEVLDFGKHHPCVLWSQFDPWGGWTWLGGVMGQDLGLGDFVRVVQSYRQQWFPTPLELLWACDPAGTHANSHGTETAISVLQSAGIYPRWAEDSNQPAIRRGCIERTAEHLRRRTAVGEAFAVDDTRWLVISATQVRPLPFAAQALEAGYVWDERTRTTAGGKSIVVPLKDGWYEHVMNCAEYSMRNFGQAQQTVTQVERHASRIHSQALKRAQRDVDPYDATRRGGVLGRGGY